MIVLPLEASSELAVVGGKAASLARLATAGLAVPRGFCVTTAAYRALVAADGMEERILALVNASSSAVASEQIRRVFEERGVPDDIADAIRSAYRALGEVAVAVRSSATAEDLPGLSFAGQQDTILNVRGDGLLVAIQRCWASLWTERAIEYRTRNGIAHEDVSLAVIVQELVPADAAGVMFTADALSGARERIVINAAWGLGEALVSGGVTPDAIAVDRSTLAIVERRTGEKMVMTVLDGTGTREVPVPPEKRDSAVLDDTHARGLAELGVRIEAIYGEPMDVEWAMHEGRFFILQARPITGTQTETWNDSLSGDYLWSNGNFGEAIPSVMTPCTWSLVERFMERAMPISFFVGHRMYGNIGGRAYMNLSTIATVAAMFGMRHRIDAALQVFGKIPEGLEVPLISASRWAVFRQIVPVAFRMRRRVKSNTARLPTFLAAAPGRSARVRADIRRASSCEALASLWDTSVAPLFDETNEMLEASGRQDGNALVEIRLVLKKWVGEKDADALLSGLQADGADLASMGPMLGLAQLARGEIGPATFAERWGHRGPDEFEISIPRPAEDPAWIARQLAAMHGTRDLDALLARQREARDAAWQRLRERHPRKVARARRMVDRWAAAARARERARSEVIRVFWALRTFVVRAGELTRRGDDLFFLTIDEILEVLRGDDRALANVRVRRATYERYRALPPYPALIRGHFDPFRWAADPDRRSDLFDEHGFRAPALDAIVGFPGAAGVVEGRARVIASVEEGDRLEPGEILVTTVTNVGWTPLFPRAAAVVTDVGAPLSHAAIVARELGIPAVVGCSNATMRIRTGDRVRVDGEHGRVEIIASASAT